VRVIEIQLQPTEISAGAISITLIDLPDRLLERSDLQ
jgi:hypothetical protein